jgi:ABC-type multidrug transport system fused ATPase/permease subunit
MILLLDEATSGLDAESEHACHRRGSRLHDSGSTIVVVHQSSTIRNAAGIAVVKDGMTVEQGKHDELMVNEGRGHMLHS